ncbi:MAG: Zn-dependent hydrolase [Solirubrobacteraceae bacterium]
MSEQTEFDRALLARSAARLEADINIVSGPAFTASPDAICRYAWTPGYQATLGWLRVQFTALGFTCHLDPVGNFFARNRPPGEPVMGLGSHCDSNRSGGAYDGTLGVVAALELCRVAADRGLDLPLQIVAFLEEEASGFGELLLGSRIIAGHVTAEDLESRVFAIDDGRSFADHARDAGLAPERADEAVQTLDGLVGWIELHIEQGRVLQDTGLTFGLVRAIAGYEHGDLCFDGRADHAGATPMDQRQDAGVAAGLCIGALEELATAAGGGTVGTVGEIVVEPGIINVIPEHARISYDVRGPDDARVGAVVADLVREARRQADRRGLGFAPFQRHRVPAQALDEALCGHIEAVLRRVGAPWQPMVSGAAHDTMSIAPLVPSAMLFVPCRDGISHHPSEYADIHDAALGVHVLLDATIDWIGATT